MKEIWKDIKGFEKMYKISNLGNVKSLDRYCVDRFVKGIEMKKETNKGYKRVVLQKNRKRKRFLVHRLVAIHFIKNPKNKKYVNHIDGNPANNNVNNLEWCTSSENQLHAYRIGLQKPLKGKDNEKCKPVFMIDLKTNKILKEFYSAGEAQEKTGVYRTGIRNCCRGVVKTAGGFNWEYKNNKFNIDKEIDKHKQYL